MSTVPVSLNGADVLKETSVADKSIISVGSCTFRFIYRDSFTPSPLQESNKPMASPAGKVTHTIKLFSCIITAIAVFTTAEEVGRHSKIQGKGERNDTSFRQEVYLPRTSKYPGNHSSLYHTSQ